MFAKRLNEAMIAKNISQSDLSALTGVGKSSISQYLSGKNEPKQTKIKVFAEALQVSEVWLMGQDVEMESGTKTENKRITVEEAARLMGKSRDFVRVGLQKGILPFGNAVQLSSRWTYYINPKRFYEYIGQN